ncbi:CinA family protein [Pseudaeromonas sharmana]|uniref:CinA family protein n=1 Tax=Pseudaeromonas sharmana TaxID=328412 RepID=A0ABV8CME4_9GAMM
MNSEIEHWARKLGALLTARGLMATTAESCTGGGVAYAITEISGSSAWFDRSFVTYTNAAKSQMLGVPVELIETHGAVSEQVVQAMALGALKRSDAQIAVALSGVAGPGGGSATKPVGLVWMAWAWQWPGNEASGCISEACHFPGDRSSVRQQAIIQALQTMCKLIQ